MLRGSGRNDELFPLSGYRWIAENTATYRQIRNVGLGLRGDLPKATSLIRQSCKPPKRDILR